MTAYILAFIMNVNNFEPVILKDCSKIELSQSKAEAQKQLSAVRGLSLKCEQIEDKISYACISTNQKLVGRIIVLKDFDECKAFAGKTSKDMKNLMNVK